jgi:hypothetical protein
MPAGPIVIASAAPGHTSPVYFGTLLHVRLDDRGQQHECQRPVIPTICAMLSWTAADAACTRASRLARMQN